MPLPLRLRNVLEERLKKGASTLTSPYSYSSIGEYLRSLQTGKHGRRRLTLSEVSRKIGYRSPRTVAMVIKGQRPPSLEMVDRLAAWQKLSPREHEYLTLLARHESARTRPEIQPTLAEKIAQFRSLAETPELLKEEVFTFVSEWYHLPLRQLVETPDFREDPDWIARRFRNKITPEEASAGLERLHALGLLKRDTETGRLRRSNSGHAWTTTGIPSEAIQNFHRGMLERSKEALEEVLLSERGFVSTALLINPDRIAEIKEHLDAFHTDFLARFFDPNGTEVFQLGSQFFKHTR